MDQCLFLTMKKNLMKWLFYFSSEDKKNDACIIKLNSMAKMPRRMTSLSVGYDLYSMESYWIFPMNRVNIDTGYACKPPPGCYCRVTGRSGLAFNNGLFVGAEVIDPDYTGSIKVLLFNCSVWPVKIEKHTRIGQMIFECCKTPKLTEEEKFICEN